MNTFVLIAGILIILAAIIDFIWTTLWVDGGAGPLTDRLSSMIWKIMRKTSGDHPKILSLAGPFILTATLVMWILLLWAGWSMVFSGEESAVVNLTDKSIATWVERVYYAGYLIFTLGNGDFAPNGSVWQIATVIATGTGMMFITLGVTYLLSVLSAVTSKRSFAESVLSIGDTAGEIVRNSWDGQDFHNIDLLLNSFSSQLSTITSQHNAYPILHYYFAEKTMESNPLAVILLDETLTVFCFGIPEKYQPNRLLLHEMRKSVKSYLKTMDSAAFADDGDEPPYPDLNELRIAGIPVVQEDEYHEALKDLSEHRQKLSGLVRVSAVKSPWENQP